MSRSLKNITLYDSSSITNTIFTFNIDYFEDITIREIKQKFIDYVTNNHNIIPSIKNIRLVMGGKLLDNDDIGIYTYNLSTYELHIRVYYKLLI